MNTDPHDKLGVPMSLILKLYRGRHSLSPCKMRWSNTTCKIGLKESQASSSVARGATAPTPHWHVDQNANGKKHYVFSTFETVLCTGVD